MSASGCFLFFTTVTPLFERCVRCDKIIVIKQVVAPLKKYVQGNTDSSTFLNHTLLVRRRTALRGGLKM